MRRSPFLLWSVVLGSLSLAAISQADTIYGITNDDNLIKVDTTNPGNSSLVGVLDTPSAALGIFSNSSNLYIYDTNQNVVRQINPLTAATVSTINIGLAAAPGEGDVAFFNGVGYLASTFAPDGSFGSSTLFKFTLNANSSSIVSTTIPALDGLAFSSTGVLYGLSQGGTELFTINPLTGATTEVGAGTGINNNCGGFSCFSFGALSFGSSGTLYASLTNFSSTTSNFYSINPTTGTATPLSSIPFDQVTGLTQLNLPVVAPEPSALLAVGLVSLLVALRRRKPVR